MPRSIKPEDLPGLLRPGMTVYAPGLEGESALVVDALKATPDAAAGVRFTGVWLPGHNCTDYAGLHPEARSTAFFVGPELRDSFAAGRVGYVPVSYVGIYTHLRDREVVDLALLHVSPPDDAGRVSLGIANDFAPAILDMAGATVAHVNPLMPRTRGTTLAYAKLDYVIEAPCALAGRAAAVDPVFAAIGGHLASLIHDGDTVEVGIGGVQGVLSAFADKRNLAIHAGALTDAVLPLVQAGAIAERDDAITTGIAWGSDALYRFVRDDPRVRFAPVGWTHAIGTLAGIDRFTAINAAIEVDLLGQVNAEMIGGRQISSAGGITDFMRGARLSKGGFSVVALPATARRGTVSRVVPQLESGTAVSVARGDVDLVATEHGIADLRGLSVDARAEALIAIAAPTFRGDLAAAWHLRRSAM
ncbi:MAG: acetyl-CoA hydrolase [Rhodospirillales bacterium]|nr:acetyl-CoA hydrolase [Rhodospirillales bacterium]